MPSIYQILFFSTFKLCSTLRLAVSASSDSSSYPSLESPSKFVIIVPVYDIPKFDKSSKRNAKRCKQSAACSKSLKHNVYCAGAASWRKKWIRASFKVRAYVRFKVLLFWYFFLIFAEIDTCVIFNCKYFYSNLSY